MCVVRIGFGGARRSPHALPLAFAVGHLVVAATHRATAFAQHPATLMLTAQSFVINHISSSLTCLLRLSKSEISSSIEFRSSSSRTESKTWATAASILWH